MKRVMVALVLVPAVLAAGCTRKQPPAEASRYAPQEDLREAVRSPERAAVLSQADLVAAAGSDRVLFELDSSDLTSEAHAILGRQAAWLRVHPEVGFTVEGHCDERGTREYNLALGDRRARSVADYLVAQGVTPGRLRTISYGKERPEALGSDDAAYAQNRRAVSIVLSTPGS